MRANFSKVQVYTGLDKSAIKVFDIREQVANALYTKGSGLACHALALKIYNAKDGEVELDADECRLLINFAENIFSPNVIDAFHALFDDFLNKKP